MKTFLLVAALVAVAPTAVLACADCNEKEHVGARTAAKTPPAAPGAGEARLTIPVSGMRCDHCASRVETALTKIEGVRFAGADVGKSQAVVIVEKSKLDAAKLIAAIDGAGYKAGTPVEN